MLAALIPPQSPHEATGSTLGNQPRRPNYEVNPQAQVGHYSSDELVLVKSLPHSTGFAPSTCEPDQTPKTADGIAVSVSSKSNSDLVSEYGVRRTPMIE